MNTLLLLWWHLTACIYDNYVGDPNEVMGPILTTLSCAVLSSSCGRMSTLLVYLYMYCGC
jgi:hypothetical protein